MPTDSEDLLNEVIANAILAAHEAVIGKEHRTGAERTRAAVTAAFECAAANGLVRLTPRDEWPEFITLTPPYTLPERIDW